MCKCHTINKSTPEILDRVGVPYLKALSVIAHSKLHLFPTTQIIFFIFRKRSTVTTYIYNNSLENSMFLEREILRCWELIFAGENLFTPVLNKISCPRLSVKIVLISCWNVFNLIPLEKYGFLQESYESILKIQILKSLRAPSTWRSCIFMNHLSKRSLF